MNAALKKRNGSQGQGTSEEGRSEVDEDDGFWKCLWLIIRRVEEDTA